MLKIMMGMENKFQDTIELFSRRRIRAISLPKN